MEGESLDVLFGSEPLIVEDAEETTEAKQAKKEQTYEEQIASTAQKEAVRAHIMQLLLERYGIEEEDFLSAEIEVVPAGDARDCGLDRSMVIGYGQDDCVCAYTSLVAQLAIEDPARTAVCILVDKEEIGSVGATGMTSAFFENTMAEILNLMGKQGDLALRRCLANSSMLSSDVSAAFDPSYASVFEPKNSAYCGRCLHSCEIRHERHRFWRGSALHALTLGSHVEGRYLRSLQRLQGLLERLSAFALSSVRRPPLSQSRY